MSMATVRFFPSIFFAWESQTKIRWETVPNLLTPGRQGQNGPECNFICAIVGVQGIRWKGKSSHVNVPPLVQHEQTLDLTQYLFCAAWISAYQLGMHSSLGNYILCTSVYENIYIYICSCHTCLHSSSSLFLDSRHVLHESQITIYTITLKSTSNRCHNHQPLSSFPII